ncbi:hypothetical protein ACFSM5_07620 [Lacibacterium aquatile]|uniref:Lipocalin-like domain-containing protein n=1 Tax=Lacibacterium aquatile TaxID=1168082 RepID=A0ABW5DNQ3_9PROT
MRLGILLLVLGAASGGALAQDASGLVGRWYGVDEKQQAGERIRWIAQFNQDGSYKINFESLRDCKLFSRSLHEGHWSLEGNIQVLKLDYYNGQANGSSTRFELLELTENQQRYRSLRYNVEYSSRRVDADFLMPDCS